jgi:hypothetical protein
MLLLFIYVSLWSQCSISHVPEERFPQIPTQKISRLIPMLNFSRTRRNISINPHPEIPQRPLDCTAHFLKKERFSDSRTFLMLCPCFPLFKFSPKIYIYIYICIDIDVLFFFLVPASNLWDAILDRLSRISENRESKTMFSTWRLWILFRCWPHGSRWTAFDMRSNILQHSVALCRSDCLVYFLLHCVDLAV